MTPRKTFFLMLGIMTFAIVGVFAGIYFTDKYLAQKSQNISKQKAKSDVLDETIVNASAAEKKLEELSFVKDLANKVLPADKTQSELIAEVSNFAKQSGMLVRGIIFTPPGEEEASQNQNKSKSKNEEKKIDFNTSQTTELAGIADVRVFPFTFNIENTNGQQLINFLKQVEKNRRKIRVVGLSVTTALEEGKPTGTVNATLNMQVYVRGK